jgi:hypothetical protein
MCVISLVMHLEQNLLLVGEFVQFISNPDYFLCYWLHCKLEYNMTEFYVCGCLYNKHWSEAIVIICPFQKYICQPYSRYILQREEDCVWHFKVQ